MTFLAMVNAIAMRTIINLALTEMVKPNAGIADATIDEHSCPRRETDNFPGNGTHDGEMV